MMAGEELGITSANVKSLAGKDNKNKEINRLLGKDPLQGISKLGLSFRLNETCTFRTLGYAILKGESVTSKLALALLT